MLALLKRLFVRPNTGLQIRHESLAEIEKKYKKVESAEAETSWRAQYSSSLRVCSHAYWRAVCRNAQDCEVQHTLFNIHFFF